MRLLCSIYFALSLFAMAALAAGCLFEPPDGPCPDPQLHESTPLPSCLQLSLSGDSLDRTLVVGTNACTDDVAFSQLGNDEGGPETDDAAEGPASFAPGVAVSYPFDSALGGSSRLLVVQGSQSWVLSHTTVYVGDSCGE